ncbi:MAG: hypothetical protein K6C08_08975 [Oscillospiraceae bacterium]|nr:hypothetical protein [Oscillospiraceae bacterium]
MALISVNCFLLIGITLIVYYLLPLKYRWCALLAASVTFYSFFGAEVLAIVAVIAVFSYYMAIMIENGKKKQKGKLILTVSIIALLAVLAFVKIGGRLASFRSLIIVPVGISYFTLSIIGYLLEVYWNRMPAEKNLFHFLTFVFFFPKIIQGPISRYKYLGQQLKAGNRFSYTQVCYGIQLMLWGIFKKLVLADRLSVFMYGVYYDVYSYAEHGLILLLAMFASAFQLYFDFSGYTDIARGISQMFGIQLEQNFNHPFFSRSAAGFWQRWHMSLSSWFKDYLFLPISRSSIVKNVSKAMGSRYGAAARKKTMIIFSTAAVWLATGLWHGTGINYIVWGMYWGGIIIASELLESTFEKSKRLLHIKAESPFWMMFQIFRTFIIFTIGKLISAQNTLYDVKLILSGILLNTHFQDIGLVSNIMLHRADYVVLFIGMITVFVISLLQEKGIRIRESISHWHAVPRWLFYSFSVSVVLLTGLYGKGYDVSTFAYQFF